MDAVEAQVESYFVGAQSGLFASPLVILRKIEIETICAVRWFSLLFLRIIMRFTAQIHRGFIGLHVDTSKVHILFINQRANQAVVMGLSVA